MDTQAKRNELKKRYRSPAWAAKVDKMSDRQVIAVYLRPQKPKK